MNERTRIDMATGLLRGMHQAAERRQDAHLAILLGAVLRLVEEDAKERADRDAAERMQKLHDAMAGPLVDHGPGVRVVLGAAPGESTAKAARRVVAERDAAIAERAEVVREVFRDAGLLMKTREVLTAGNDETVADAAARVVAERDDLRRRLSAVDKILGTEEGEHTDAAARRLAMQRDEAHADVQRVRTVLAAGPDEPAAKAAERVVAERDEARAALEEVWTFVSDEDMPSSLKEVVGGVWVHLRRLDNFNAEKAYAVVDAVRGALGARDGKCTAAEAKRVVGERDEVIAELDAARLDRDTAIQETREVLGAAVDEPIADAARRVVGERDEARLEAGAKRRRVADVSRERDEALKEVDRWASARTRIAEALKPWGVTEMDAQGNRFSLDTQLAMVSRAGARLIRERAEAIEERDQARAERDAARECLARAEADHGQTWAQYLLVREQYEALLKKNRAGRARLDAYGRTGDERVRDIVSEAIMGMSEAEIEALVRAEGKDPAEVAARMRARINDLVAKHRQGTPPEGDALAAEGDA